MPASALATDLTVLVDGGHVAAIRPGDSESILDARPPARLFSEQEEAEALERFQKKAGAAPAAIERAVRESFDAVRRELNQVAGGQASPIVMAKAHYAQRAHLALELQASISLGRYGQFVDATDKGQTEKGLRGMAGMAAVASDLLTKAYDAAKEEAEGKRCKPVDALLTRIGAAEVRPEPPIGVGGGSVPGSLHSDSEESPK